MIAVQLIESSVTYVCIYVCTCICIYVCMYICNTNKIFLFKNELQIISKYNRQFHGKVQGIAGSLIP